MWALEKSKKDQRIVMCQILNNVVGVPTKEYRNGWKNNNWTFPSGKDNTGNRFQLS
jgi:hypothetical protein